MKLTILFVDDDANLLQGLQRMLRGLRHDWDMTFANGGPNGLELLKTKPFDVVISDMRMPELDGAELLSEVERRYPGTMRVILSGYAEEKSVFRSIGPAHQYLAKPCDPETIIALMERTLRLQAVLTAPSLRELTAGLRNLPSPPDLYLRLTAALQREDVSTGMITQMVKSDLAMTAELLKVTNSSYFGLSSRMTTASQAVMLLGMGTVRTLVLHANIFRQYQGETGDAAKLQSLSDYALTIGALAERFAEENGADETIQAQAKCAGLLSTIGVLALFDAYPERFSEVMATITDSCDLEDAERAAFGGSHCEVGAYLLGLWGFPEPMVEALRYQLRPSDCLCRERSLLSYVHLARVFGPSFPFASESESPQSPLDQVYVKRLDLKIPQK